MPKIEVIYATIKQQKLIKLVVDDSSTIQQCIELSGVLQHLGLHIRTKDITELAFKETLKSLPSLKTENELALGLLNCNVGGRELASLGEFPQGTRFARFSPTKR